MKRLWENIKRVLAWIVAIVLLLLITIGLPYLTYYCVHDVYAYYRCEGRATGEIIKERTSHHRGGSVCTITILYVNDRGEEVVFENQMRGEFRTGQKVPVRYSQEASFCENYNANVHTKLIIAAVCAAFALRTWYEIITDLFGWLMSIIRCRSLRNSQRHRDINKNGR